MVQAHLDGETVDKQLTLDSNVDLLQFVSAASRYVSQKESSQILNRCNWSRPSTKCPCSSRITVGSESVRANSRDVYGMEDAAVSDEVVDIRTESLPLK